MYGVKDSEQFGFEVRSLHVGILEKDTKPIFGHYLCSFGYKHLIVDLIALNGQ